MTQLTSNVKYCSHSANSSIISSHTKVISLVGFLCVKDLKDRVTFRELNVIRDTTFWSSSPLQIRWGKTAGRASEDNAVTFVYC